MPTREFARFDPALTVVLTAAFDQAWQTVVASGVAATLDGAAPAMREAIARRIVAMAEAGMTNASELAMDALAHVTEMQSPAGGESAG